MEHPFRLPPRTPTALEKAEGLLNQDGVKGQAYPYEEYGIHTSTVGNELFDKRSEILEACPS